MRVTCILGLAVVLLVVNIPNAVGQNHQHSGTPVGRVRGAEHPERIPLAVSARLYVTNNFREGIHKEATEEVKLTGNDVPTFITTMLEARVRYSMLSSDEVQRASVSDNPNKIAAEFSAEVTALVNRTLGLLKSRLTPEGYSAVEQRLETFKKQLNISETEAVK